MGPTYTLDMTNLVGPLQEIAEFAHHFCYGLVASSLPP